MKPRNLLIVAALWVWGSLGCFATVRYVDVNSPQPAPPYTNWVSAAQTIQDAVDAADPGDQILVTNGVYKSGGLFFYDMSNRVAVTKPLLLSSVNGPDVTLIQGVQVPDTLTGPGAVRCVYMTNGATLIGFTLTNGSTLGPSTDYWRAYGGGGVYANSRTAMVSNCIVLANAAYSFGGGASGVSLYNCAVSNNSVWELSSVSSIYGGGGVGGCFLSHCTIVGNSSVQDGGGAISCTLVDCAINNNTAGRWGGGTYVSTLFHCGVTNNVAAYSGGGSYYSFLTNSSVVSNYAPEGGGLWRLCIASNCLIAFNRAETGGGADEFVGMIYCLVLSNYAAQAGGGAAGTQLTHCILAGNSAPTGAAAVGASLSNCTLTNNTGDYGGAVADCTLTNCVISGNVATVTGGGAYSGTLINCLLTGNTAGGSGGGAANDPNTPLTLINCTVAGNWATNTCGGVDGGTVNNSIVYGNIAPSTRNYSPYDSLALTGTLFTNSCTTPLPIGGTGNLSEDPIFIDSAGGNLRLQTNSPCINAADKAYVTASTDLDGRPRIKGGTVDMGAYEFQGDGMGEFTAWLLHYGLPTDGSADYADPDGDSLNNWQEWICDTNPTNAASLLRFVSITNLDPGTALTWASVNTRKYFVQRSVGFSTTPAFITMATNITGQVGSTTYVDTNANRVGTLGYRVGVHR